MVQALDSAGEPGNATRLAGALGAVEVDDLLGRDALVALRADLLVAELIVAGVIRQEVVGDRPAPAVHLNTHSDLVALLAAAVQAIIQLVRLDHLHRQRDGAAAEGLPHQADEHLAALRAGADDEALDVGEAQLPAGVAVLRIAPPLPRCLDGIIDAGVQLAAALHPHLALERDALPDHVAFNRAQCLPRVVVIPAQLPRTVAQLLRTAVHLAVGAGVAGHPVSRQP